MPAATARRHWIRLTALLAAFASFGCQAAFDAYLKIEGVDGESPDARHDKWIDVNSFTHGSSGPSLVSPRPTFQPLCLTKPLDKASPILFQRCASGAVIPSARLELISTDTNRVRFYQVILSNVVFTSVAASGQTSDPAPTETVCLNFGRIEWIYTEYDITPLPKGDIGTWWDLALNTGGSSITPVLRVVGAPVAGGLFRLSWTAKAGRTYSIRRSPDAAGQFQGVGSVSSPTDGPLTYDLPLDVGAGFFNLEEAP